MCIRDSGKYLTLDEYLDGKEEKDVYYVSDPQTQSQYINTVSYTHLDVYKRQVLMNNTYEVASPLWTLAKLIASSFPFVIFLTMDIPVSYTHLHKNRSDGSSISEQFRWYVILQSPASSSCRFENHSL